MGHEYGTLLLLLWRRWGSEDKYKVIDLEVVYNVGEMGSIGIIIIILFPENSLLLECSLF